MQVPLTREGRRAAAAAWPDFRGRRRPAQPAAPGPQRQVMTDHPISRSQRRLNVPMFEEKTVRAHQDALFRQIKSYLPIRGQRIQISPALADAFFRFPRHAFVSGFRRPGAQAGAPVTPADPGFLAGAYENSPLMYVDEAGRMLPASSSEPAFILHLAALLDVQPGQRVLEIGCGTGWLMALLSHLVGPEGHVTGVEINPRLHAEAVGNLRAQGLANITVIAGDGFTACGPGTFDRLIMTASAYQLPHRLLTILTEGGKAIIPIRNRGLAEEAHLLERRGDRLVSCITRLCKFVPVAGPSATGTPVIPLADDTAINRLRTAALSRSAMAFGQEAPGDMLRHALPFTAFLSKVAPDFRAWSMGQSGRGQLDVAVFGDPDNYGFGLVDETRGSAAIWHKGEVTAFGTPDAANALTLRLTEWVAAGRPSGFAFGLTVTAAGAAPPTDASTQLHREDRGDLTFWWHIRPPDLRL
ncbi:methyltransferase domain-containing protein [Tistrella bauzanensis]|uniref:Protein-L-isoaspartate O-methyltransferase n=2 Tax=Tistrella TaxID=171436 RepID=A0ABU9YHH8_9PROT